MYFYLILYDYYDNVWEIIYIDKIIFFILIKSCCYKFSIVNNQYKIL